MAIYINKNNQNSGPFDELSVEKALRNGTFSINDLGCREGMSAWQPLGVFFPHLQIAAPFPASGFRCPFCQSTQPPLIRQNISTAGWVWFILLFGSCIGTLFCWIGLLMKENYRVCGSCGIKLG
jgi:hypothetical protein